MSNFRSFQTSKHSLGLAIMLNGERVVSLFPIGADGKPDTDTELFYKAFGYHDKQAAEACFNAQRTAIAPAPVSAARATEIIQKARAAAQHGPWCDQLDQVMTVDERAAVKLNWEGRPGNWSFVSTLTAISRGK